MTLLLSTRLGLLRSGYAICAARWIAHDKNKPIVPCFSRGVKDHDDAQRTISPLMLLLLCVARFDLYIA